ncbi:hypothetical protein FACS189413_07850 [Bacteroidia bacterium]|nr:hypothetical protein FACS189413_07850 [Bacteroidia bacterium]
MKTIIVMIGLLQPILLIGQIIHPVSFKDIYLQDSKIKGEYVEILPFDNLCFIANMDEGSPMIPSTTIHVYLPENSTIDSIFIKNPVIQTFKLKKAILPFQGEIPIKETEPKAFVLPRTNIYERDVSYPEQQIKINDIGYYDYINRIVSLNVCPFQYKALQNELLFFSSFDIQINFKKELKKETIEPYKIKNHRNLSIRKKYDELLSRMVVNPQDIQNDFSSDNVDILRTTSNLPDELTYEYVVVTTEALAPSFKRFIAWKKRKGINIGIVTMEYIRTHYTGDLISGIYDDAGKLRQFLFEAYGNNLMYALLAGDKNNVPIRIGCSVNNQNVWDYTIPTDLYFADFNGDWNVDNDNLYGEPTNDNPDYMVEIFVGRILCSVPQHIENWVEKLIRYEKNPGNGNLSYLNRAFYTQADEMQQANCIASVISAFPNFSTHTVFNEMYNGSANYNSPGRPQFPTGIDISNEFNNNYGLVSFMGHGSQCTVGIASQGVNTEPRYRLFFANSYHYDNSSAYYEGGSFVMKNHHSPNINYSISCETMPFDDLGSGGHTNHLDNLGKSFTILSKNGSVAYLGNTRNGYTASSPVLMQYFGTAINNGNYNIGIAEATSLNNTTNKTLKYSHNLLGCPEMEMWTAIPSYFNSVSVTQIGTSVIVNTGGIPGCKIALMSMDYGISYFEVADNVSSYTFTGVNVPYYVTITKHNFIPYTYPQDVYIQNLTLDHDYYIQGRHIYAGHHVTNTLPQGNVLITNNANVIFDAAENVVFEPGFECALGATFEVVK